MRSIPTTAASSSGWGWLDLTTWFGATSTAGIDLPHNALVIAAGAPVLVRLRWGGVATAPIPLPARVGLGQPWRYLHNTFVLAGPGLIWPVGFCQWQAWGGATTGQNLVDFNHGG